MRFAFIIMGPFDSVKDRAVIHNGAASIVGISSIEEACSEAKRLKADGVSCIELCGAFGPDGAKKVVEATDNSLPIGYVTHLDMQDEVFRKVFGE